MAIYDTQAALQGRPTVGVSAGVGGVSANNPAQLGSLNPKTPQQIAQDAAAMAAQQKYDAEVKQSQATAQQRQQQLDDQQRAAAMAGQQQQASYQNAAMAGLGAAGPVSSNYTGAPTSPIDADRAKLQLEAEFAAQQAQNQATVQTQSMKDSAALQAEAEARRLGYMPQIMAGLPGMVTHGSGASGQQEEAARAAAFARAKEQAGGTALGALRGLEDYSAGRGQTGSSMERRMIGDVVGGAAGQINEYSRDQLMADLQRAAQLSDQEYQGNITQRGQNLALTPSLLGLVGARAVY